jgi:hypothetical protein
MSGALFAITATTYAEASPPPVTYSLTVTTAGDGYGAVTSNPAGISSPTLTAAFAENTSVTLSANAQIGSTFAGWSGAASGLAPAQITMDSDKTVTATFDLNSPPPPPPASVPTGNIVGRWNAPGAGQFGGDPIIWPEASGYSWAKFYHLATYSLGGNGTIGYSGDGSSSYIQTPIHMTPGDFTLAFTARLNPTGNFPQGIFDCSQSGAYNGLRAYWTDATHIVITSPGTGTGAIDMTGSGWHTYGPSFFTIRMKLDNIANTGSIDIFVNGTAWSNVGAPRGALGFPATDAGINMILGALVDDSGTKVGFLESTWYNFIYYSRALSNSEVTQLYTAQQAGLLNPTPATTYSFVSNFTAGQASSNIYIDIGFGGMGPTVPPDQMGGWYVSGPGISDVATVTSITNIVNDSQFIVSIDQTILQGSGTYTFTAP